MKKNIFVLGTGRSGTHWLGYILDSSNEINMNIEKFPIFKWVTQAAVNYKKRKRLIPLIIIYFKLNYLLSKKHSGDKSHPNIWLVDYYNKYLSNAYFIGIHRDPHPTVSSMLLHKGVLRWIDEWEEYPLPNSFLGITLENVEDYKKLSLESKCVMRWIAHMDRFKELEKKYSNNFLLIDYENLYDSTENEIDRIHSFLELKEKLPFPEIKKDSKFKWKSKLTQEQINNINETLKNSGYDKYVV